MNPKYLIAAVIAAVVGLAIYGAYLYPSFTQQELVSSPAGSTFSSAKVATIVMEPATGTATSTSVYNSDASDRKIEDFVVSCSNVGNSQVAYTGAGLPTGGWNFTFATTSTANPATIDNTNSVKVAIGTSTPNGYNVLGNGTTTPSALVRLWAAGSYLSIAANATNTASCVVGVNYLAS